MMNEEKDKFMKGIISEIQIERLSFKKIFFHVDRLNDYLKTGDSFPIHLVLGFTDFCNQDCIYCYTAYSTHNNLIMEENGEIIKLNKSTESRMIKPEVLLTFLKDAKDKGLKAVTIVGSGESLLHPDAAYMLRSIGEMGIDFGIFSNGQILNNELLDVIATYGTFFRFSLDAADPVIHKKMRGRNSNFDQVITNMRRLLHRRSEMGKALPTIGAQFVVCQINYESMIPFAKMMKEIGIDYITFKPLYKNPLNEDRISNTLTVEEALDKLTIIKGFESERFRIYDKEGEQFISAWGDQANNGGEYYKKCMAHQFSPVIYGNGDMYLCLNLGGHKEFMIGNIYENTIEDIWSSQQRKKAISSIDLVNKCPARCKLDPLNKILWDITHPDPEVHPNFF